MESKMIKMHKMLKVGLGAICVGWAIIMTKGDIVFGAILLAFMTFFGVRDLRKQVDERQWYLHIGSSYFALICTMGFLFAYDAIRRFKTGQNDPLIAYTLGVMVLSQTLFHFILKGKATANG